MGKLSQAAAAIILALTLTLALTLASGVTEVRAQGTGADLLKLCRGEHKAYCAGYIAGLYDGVATDQLLDEKLDICLPARRGTAQSSISYKQMVQIYVEWASANRGRVGGIDRFVAVRLALSESFPCREKGPATSPPPSPAKAEGKPASKPTNTSEATKSGENSE